MHQGLNSLHNNNNNSSINHPQSQIQMNDMNHHHFDDPTNSQDDFLKQMLSNLPPSSSSWNTLDPNSNNPKPLWDNTNPDNVAFEPYDVERTTLASKFRNHQITDKAAALMLLMPRTASDSGLLQMPLSLGAAAGDFDSSQNDVVDASSFKSPTSVSHKTPINYKYSLTALQ